MSRHDDLDLFDGEGRHDPVADFFARERDAVEELPGHDLHFQGILRKARPARRGTRWLAAGVAAAAVAGVAAAAVVAMQPGDEQANPAGPPSTVSLPTPSPATTPPAVPVQPMDGQFLPRSLSSGDDATRAVLGAARCGEDSTCAVILRTTDDGAGWVNTAALPDLTVAPPGGVATEADQVGILRWADAEVGYLAGSTIRRTTDGGATWADMPYPGGTIIAAEIGDGIVRFVSAGECTDDGCSGPLKVYQAGTGDDVADVVALEADLGGITDAHVVVRGGLLAVHTEDGSHAYRLGATSERIEPCDEGEQVWFTSPANGEVAPVAACVSTDDDRSTVSLRTTDDEGLTWTDLSGPAEVTGEVSGFTSPGPGTFVLATRGADRAGTIVRSTDEGRSWQPAAADPVRWTWVAAGGGERVYGLAEDSVGFLESTDGGATWRTQVLAP